MLRDYRIKTIREKKPAIRVQQFIIPYLIEALDRFDPHALLVPETCPVGARHRSSHGTKAIQAIVSEALSRGIAVHVVSSADVKKSFVMPDGSPARNRHEIHCELIRRFPELGAMLPRPRIKLWEEERYFTPLFNAVAMYLAWQGRPSGVDRV